MTATGDETSSSEEEDAIASYSSTSNSDDEEWGPPDKLNEGQAAVEGADMAAETQRILRDVASRDRIGKSSTLEIKPLSSMLDKLKQKNELLRQNAKQRVLPDQINFEDILSEAVNTGVLSQIDADNIVPCRDDNAREIIVVDDVDSIDARIVELPSTIKKKDTLWDFPATADFEDEAPLIDDGYKSPSTSEDEDGLPSDSGLVDEKSNSLQSLLEETDSEDSSIDKREEEQSDTENQLQDTLPQRTPPLLVDIPGPITLTEKRAQKVKNVFIEHEAELSEDEGGDVSEDEDEDGLDNNVELEGFIEKGDKEKQKDKVAREVAHQEWQRAQDAKELAAVLRGVRQGFRRGRNELSDDEDDAAGRRRRLKLEEDGNVSLQPFAGLDWPNNSYQDSEDEVEDEVLLQKAAHHRLLANSQDAIVKCSNGEMPFDEDSQQVLELLKSSSEPVPLTRDQHPRKFWAQALGLPGSEAHQSAIGFSNVTHSNAPSFVGKAPPMVRTASTLGYSGKSYIFGRDSNNMALAPSGDLGPTSFSNLEQLTKPNENPKMCNKKSAPSLMSRLAQGNCHGKIDEESYCAAKAVVEQVILAPKNKK